MGKVFSPEEVAVGHVPKPGAHLAAADFILDNLFTASADGLDGVYQGCYGVDSAIIYGSTIHRPTRRSDVDLLILYHPQKASIAQLAIERVVTDATSRFHVPVDGEVIPTEITPYYSRTPVHGLEDCDDFLYLSSLLRVQTLNPQWSRNKPVPTGAIARDSTQGRAQRLAIGHCQSLVKYLDRGLEADTLLQTSLLQCALEVPEKIGRKILAATVTKGEDPFEVSEHATRDKSWGRKQLVAKLRSIAPQPDTTIAKLAKLHVLDSDYSELLEATIGGNTEITDYTSWLSFQSTSAGKLARDVAATCVAALSHMEEV